jgi:hypothetical protein
MGLLNKRIADLELQQPNIDPIVIIIRFTTPGNLHPQFNLLSLHEGPTWNRKSNESDLAFENRVLLEAKCTQSSSNNLLFVSGS